MKWWYHDAEGTPIFQHYRVNDPSSPRGKRYGYRYPTRIEDKVVLDWDWHKHPLADSLIYKLPLVLANPRKRLYFTEGERCADEFLNRGLLATSHHGGAGKFTQAMADSLAGHRGRIVLVADRDPQGAYDVCRRFDLLRGVGIPAIRLRVVYGLISHPGADARDHFDAGYGVEDFERVSLRKMRELAATVTPATFTDDGYCTPEEIEQLRNWRPEVVARDKSSRR